MSQPPKGSLHDEEFQKKDVIICSDICHFDLDAYSAHFLARIRFYTINIHLFFAMRLQSEAHFSALIYLVVALVEIVSAHHEQGRLSRLRPGTNYHHFGTESGLFAAAPNLYDL